jgi:pSer/pThr/pTyr-binding forkhead associated (FHA) protein
MSSVEHLARTAYEAHRDALSGSVPVWEDVTDSEQEAWRAAVSAVAGQTGVTLTDAQPTQAPPLEVQVGVERRSYQGEFTAGRQGSLAITDDYASNHHARFQVTRGLWYVKDLGSTNGTWLNGRRIYAAQRLKKGDKIKIGHTVVIVVSV